MVLFPFSPTRPQTISALKSTSRSDPLSLLFLNVYSPPIRNTQLDSRPRPFSPELLPNSPDSFILGECPSLLLEHPHLSRQYWQFPIQLALILPARHPQRPRHTYATPPLFWLSILFRCLTGSVLFNSHIWMAHPLRSGLRPLPYWHQSPACSNSPHQYSSPSLQLQKGLLWWIQKIHHWSPSPSIEEMQNIYCAARSFSSLLLNEAKAYIPFVFLAVLLKHGGPRKRRWLWVIGGGRAPKRIAPRLIASHILKRHGERPQSSLGPKPRPGRHLQ